MSNKQKHFIVTDFDGTLAATFENSRNGMNVNIASDHAVLDVFGDGGHKVYQEIGGLKNREPGELVRIIQQGIGQEIQNISAKDLTEQYVEAKLSYLVPEITPEWPQLYPGVKEFFQASADGRLPVNIGVVSSGHDGFIKRVFEVNDIPPPDILVTSDILQLRKTLNRERYKPHTYQFAEAHYQWKKLSTNDGENYTGRTQGKPNIAYIGDDPVKDGGLAEQARVAFIFVPFTKPGFEPRAEKGQLLATDFFMLGNLLSNYADDLKEGRSFASILFGKEDTELFPPLAECERPYAKWLVEAMNSGVRSEKGF